MLYVSIINAFLGILFGFFPLLAGIMFKNRKYGVYGFLGSIIGGAILGVFLSFPIAILLTWLILRSPLIKDNVVFESPAEVAGNNNENNTENYTENK
jgi:hypothetical protein